MKEINPGQLKLQCRTDVLQSLNLVSTKTLHAHLRCFYPLFVVCRRVSVIVKNHYGSEDLFIQSFSAQGIV